MIDSQPVGISPGGGPETEEERRRRIQQAALDEAPVEDVPEPLPIEEEEPDVIQAPQILGTESPETSDVMSQYKDWMGRRPIQESEEYKPSTGRKIASGLLGFLSGLGNPEAGGRVTEALLNDKYNRAKGNWEEEGKALGEVGKFSQGVSETRRKRESGILGFEGTQARVEATRSGIEQRKSAETTRHQDRMANLTSENERAAEVKRHNKELEVISKERNRISGVEAGARTTSANAYASRVENLNERPDAGTGKEPPYNAKQQALHDSIGEMLAEYPDAEQWFARSPKDKSKLYLKPGLKLSPVDAQRLRAFLKDAEARSKKKLGSDQGPDPVDDYNPLRMDIP